MKEWPTRRDLCLQLEISLPLLARLEKRGYLQPYLFEGKETRGRPEIRYDPTEVEVLLKAKERSQNPDAEENGIFREGGEMGASAVIQSITGAMRQAQGHAQMMVTQFKELLTAVTDMSTKTMTAMHEENKRLRERAGELETKSWESWGLIRDAYDNQNTRQIEEQDAMASRRMKEQAFDQLTKYAPVLATLLGSKIAPGNPIPKEAALTGVVDEMTPEQLEVVIKSGALTQAQVSTFLAVKERLIEERQERLKTKATAMEEEEKLAEEQKKRTAETAGIKKETAA
jgi:hypothetical protein